MFESSAGEHVDWMCKVGYQDAASKKFYLAASGCVISKNHVLTAHHVWKAGQGKGNRPYVAREDGTYFCDVAFKSEEYDIVALKHTGLIGKPSPVVGEDYPTLCSTPVGLGASVGFVSQLELRRPDEDPIKTLYFGGGYVAIHLPDSGGRKGRKAIYSTVTQDGFSGSAIFRPNGEIVGVYSQAFNFLSDLENPRPSDFYSMAVMAPIHPVLEELNQCLGIGS